jgi:glycine/D-amino acid oxidase-like deaminating enzyme
MLAEEGLTELTEVMPAGVHARPDGEEESRVVLLLWEYDAPVFEPVFPLPKDDLYPEVVLRGMTTILPAMKPYLNRLPRPFVDGGYYTKTRENRPLACPLPVEGAFVIGALSGFGIMSALAMGELLAAHITGAELPPYAPAFDLRRYDDPAYQRRLEKWGERWQL